MERKVSRHEVLTYLPGYGGYGAGRGIHWVLGSLGNHALGAENLSGAQGVSGFARRVATGARVWRDRSYARFSTCPGRPSPCGDRPWRDALAMTGLLGPGDRRVPPVTRPPGSKCAGRFPAEGVRLPGVPGPPRREGLRAPMILESVWGPGYATMPGHGPHCQTLALHLYRTVIRSKAQSIERLYDRTVIRWRRLA